MSRLSRSRASREYLALLAVEPVEPLLIGYELGCLDCLAVEPVEPLLIGYELGCLDCLAVEPVEPLLIGYSYAFRPVFGQIVWSYHLIRNTDKEIKKSRGPGEN